MELGKATGSSKELTCERLGSIRRTELLSTDQESNLIEAFDVAQADQNTDTADELKGGVSNTITHTSPYVECR